METPTQLYCCKQSCGVGVPGVAYFRSESQDFFLDLMKSEYQIGIGFFRFSFKQLGGITLLPILKALIMVVEAIFKFGFTTTIIILGNVI